MRKKQITPAVGGASCVEQITDNSIFEELKAEREETATLNRFNLIAELSKSLSARIEKGQHKETAKQSYKLFEVAEDERTQIEYLLDAGGVGVLPMGDISAVKGLAKHGKTWFVSILCASVLGCDGFGYTATKKGKVLYIDTEQHRADASRVRKRILSLAGADASERLKVLAVRELQPTERANLLEAIITDFRPSFVVVDGVADLINDFNNVGESTAIITYLTQLASGGNCHILNVLHTARTSESGGMKGHLGSMLLQKCSDCFGVKKTKALTGAIFTATHEDTRHGEAQELNFSINKDLPILADEALAEVVRAKQNAKEEQKRAEVAEIFGAQKSLSYAELIARIVEVTGKSENSAKVYFSRSLKGYTEKDDNNKYFIGYK